MKIINLISLAALILQGCISQFVPEGGEFNEYIAVDALISDQNRSYKVEISRSSPLNRKFVNIPIKGGRVTISDDLGNSYIMKEKKSGQYVSDSLTFKGETGRKYTLSIDANGHHYESAPTEMIEVPQIDSLYAEIVNNYNYLPEKIVQGYQVFLDTHDPLKKCKFYRWNLTETWEFHIPYTYPTIVNNICWKAANSYNIFTDNTTARVEDRVFRFPLNFITTETDRLQVRYSLLLRQYSLNEDEFNYWEKLKRMTEDVGGPYDVVPASIESNIYCTDNPSEKVLGYFCVSAVTSKRLFIKNALSSAFKNNYEFCASDTIPVNQTIPDLGVSTWIISMYYPDYPPGSSFYITTNQKRCVDCTLDGSNIKPDFWTAAKNEVEIQNILK